jgi:uncharacterized protein (DUF2235 family)
MSDATGDATTPETPGTVGGSRPHPRIIVVLCDGTGKQYGDTNTNVVHAYELLRGRSANQLVLYDPGIGTFAPPWLERRFGDGIGRGLSKLFGYGLRENLTDTYKFLMTHYEAGDQLFLLGFSRGAFTVRCLAGLLTRCGLLWPHEDNLVPYVVRHYFNLWKDDGRQAERKAVVEGFKATFTRPCTPDVVAVWDTVAAYGWFGGARFSNTTLDPAIPFGFQALALDEFRVKFRPSLWQPAADNQKIEQLWFAGAHSDVGGGYAERGLSDIALAWLLGRAERQGLRLVERWQDRLHCNPGQDLHDESTKFHWRLLNGWAAIFGARPERCIPENAERHASVDERQRLRPDYRPGEKP